jgi:hypothetical protein
VAGSGRFVDAFDKRDIGRNYNYGAYAEAI